MLKKLIFRLFGTKAHTQNSAGYYHKGHYMPFKGYVSAGDCIMRYHKDKILYSVAANTENKTKQ